MYWLLVITILGWILIDVHTYYHSENVIRCGIIVINLSVLDVSLNKYGHFKII